MSLYIKPPEKLNIKLSNVLDVKRLNKNDFRYIYTYCNNIKEFESIPGFIERALKTGLFKYKQQPHKLNVLRNPFKKIRIFY